MVSLDLDNPHLAERYDVVSERQYNHGLGLIADLGIAKGHHVLDVGTGTGRLAEYVASLTGTQGRFVGIDPLPLRIAIAQRRLGTRGEARVGTAEDLSVFATASFDRVYYNSVFHWLPDKARPLAEARRVLKPGGLVGITTAAKERPHQFAQVIRSVVANGHFTGIDPQQLNTPYTVSGDELHRLFQDAGLRPESIRIRTFVDHFPDYAAVEDFNLSSSFGNFLTSAPEDQRARLRRALAAELERLRTPEGIRLERNLIFAIAAKP